jgi:RNA polymerase sigma-70 factor (ECF subfamily)
VTAYRSLASWRGEGPFGAWLTRIAVRIAVRQAGRRKTVAWRDPFGRERREAPDPIDAAMDQASLDATSLMDPSSLALRAERATDVRTAVAALPEPYREIVTLRFFGELSLDEIARQTDRPINTVKTHLYRGLVRLRASLAEEADR